MRLSGTDVNPRSSPTMILLITVFVTDEASANQFFRREVVSKKYPAALLFERGVKINQACASSGTRVFVEEMSQITLRQAEFRLALDISGKEIRLASEAFFCGRHAAFPVSRNGAGPTRQLNKRFSQIAEQRRRNNENTDGAHIP